MTPVASIATYVAEVQGVRYCGWVAHSEAGMWSGCVIECDESKRIGLDTHGQTVALRPIAETHRRCIVQTASAEIVAAVARLSESPGILYDVDVSISRLLVDRDIRAVMQPESDGIRREAARALVRGAFAYGAREYVIAVLSRCSGRAARAAEILRQVSRQALADALGISVRTVHTWARRGVGLPHVDAVADLLGLPAQLVR